jgi:hypothetical protein
MIIPILECCFIRRLACLPTTAGKSGEILTVTRNDLNRISLSRMRTAFAALSVPAWAHRLKPFPGWKLDAFIIRRVRGFLCALARIGGSTPWWLSGQLAADEHHAFTDPPDNRAVGRQYPDRAVPHANGNLVAACRLRRTGIRTFTHMAQLACRRDYRALPASPPGKKFRIIGNILDFGIRRQHLSEHCWNSRRHTGDCGKQQQQGDTHRTWHALSRSNDPVFHCCLPPVAAGFNCPNLRLKSRWSGTASPANCNASVRWLS